MLELDLAMTLHLCLRVQQRHRIDELLRLSNHLNIGIDGTMVTAPVILMTAVLLDRQRAVRVILDQDTVGVRHALIILIHVVVSVLFSLICWHECRMELFVLWEDTVHMAGGLELIELGEELWRLIHLSEMLRVGVVEAEV